MAHLTDWKKRLKITIDNTNIDSALTHFPITLFLGTSVGLGSDDVSCVFDEVGANSKKIAVTKDDGVTQLYVEIELWDYANEKAVLHVSKSDFTVSGSADTILYLYYDSSKADNTSYVGLTTETPALSVWDSNFKRVYHMAQDPSGGANSIKDSTSNASHGTPAGSMTSADLVNSTPGKGLDLDGSNDEIQYSSLTVASNVTVEAMVLFNSVYRQHVAVQGNGANYYDFWLGTGSSNQVVFGLKNTTQEVATGSALSTGTQYYLAGSYDASYINLYPNGAPVAPVARTVNPPNTGLLRTGVWYNNTAFGGWSAIVVSELRISLSTRSAEWIKATNYTLKDTIITWGDEEVSSVTDFSLDLSVHGSHLDLFCMILETISMLAVSDLKLDLEAKAQLIEHFKMLLQAGRENIDSFIMMLAATDGTVFDNFVMLLEAVDGTVFDNFTMILKAVKATPAFRSVTAHRVSSVISEVV
jgi:hypothetical protein